MMPSSVDIPSMPNNNTTPEKPHAVAACNGGNPASIR